ncbi:hypothetical protein PFICI_12067 [Pestalotiopsis fici W106-1]|uniref:Uncharacterized protein n=1 Tax=Pestalotiopsis fici (strain W106-1 / CGMCC3.15140) TaxID=1229662 RepID=W3WS52_PESFW|nr:uncharacterized protein PFICI_12067 [Pestalotiopsis fici W106-1]ETS76680.1 hypothetical protein PFICI_12067 [Pestalotiopsis fici W106-1]
MSRLNHEELVKRVEEQHARYISSLGELHESMGGRTLEGQGPVAPTPPMKPISVTSTFLGDIPPISTEAARRSRRLTNELGDRRALLPKNTPASLLSLDLDMSDDEDFAQPPSNTAPEPIINDKICVQQSLPEYTYHDNELYFHIKGFQFPEATQIALDDVYRRREELEPQNLFQLFNDQHDKLYDSAAYQVFDIGRDALARPRHAAGSKDSDMILDAKTVWDTLKHIDGSHVVGRMTSLMDPSPLMLGALHLSMQSHFDMDELFQHLVTREGNKGKTKAYMDRAFETSETRQRSCFFVFKYYTVVGDRLTPAPWQHYDHRPADKRAADHIDICECSSILALSLSGDPVRTFERKKRKSKAEQGKIYDSFAPWQLLNIQCFPDDVHVMRSEDSQTTFCSGPLAFLDALVMEYRDAVKRNIDLSDVITKLITPPVTFMFDDRLRDKLLFEDKHFTYSRRYFWAYNSLAVINDGIKSMMNAYTDTFTKDFWAGKHPTLFPHPDSGAQNSPEYVAYIAKLRPLRHELETAVALLHQVHAKNEATRQEIKSLRDQLFSGSSVKESRRAIEQGDNIKVLTSLSMIFYPLTFVTSVWSMTGFPLDVDDWQFPVTMICACVPFIVFILLVQTRTGMEFLMSHIERLDERFKLMMTRRGMLKRTREASSIAVGKTESAAEPRPRRRPRRFSKRETVVINVQPPKLPDGNRWLWWRKPGEQQGVV